MCEPTSIIAGISAISGFASQHQSARKQSAAGARSAQVAADQDSAAKSTAMGQRIKQGRIERARMAVAGGESGAEGAAFEAALADSLFQQSDDIGLIRQQARFDGQTIQTQAAVNESRVNRPSSLSLAAELGTSAYDGLQIKADKKNAAANPSSTGNPKGN